MNFYVTTYCNKPHLLSNGYPVEHECRVIPPAALQAERNGDTEKAIQILQKSQIVMRRRRSKLEPSS